MQTYPTTQPGPLPGPYVVQSPGVVTVNDNSHPATKNRSIFLGIGIIEIIIGVLCLALGIAVLLLVYPYSYVGSGVWGGIWYIIAGCLGIASGVRPSNCNIIAGLVITILTSLVAFSSIIIDSTAAVFYAALWYQNVMVGLHGTLAFLAFVEFIIAIVHSAYCCGSGCGNRSQGQVLATTTVMTVPTMQQGYQQPPPGQMYTNWNAQPQQTPQPAPAYSQPEKM